MDLSFFLFFAATVLVASLIPGPSTILSLTSGARHGLASSLMVTWGVTVASMVQALLACAGLGLVISQSALLFLAIKYLGAAYLIYMGVVLWRAAAESVALAAAPGRGVTRPPAWKLFAQGFLVAASNPKAIVFFTALLPQFLDPAENSVLKMVEMILIVGVGAFLVGAIYGVIGARIGALSATRAVMKWFYRVAGGLMVGSGAGVAFARVQAEP